ncbi:hypothetical protein M0Q28_02235 [Patescibacteria group bacterium]|jgi:hypothetical protein|nr:hypothetical protein [Patescibacteria group bacterium]
MNVDYASITLPKKDLAELHRGLLLRHIVENGIRREEGLEEADEPKVLAAVESALGLNEDEAHALFHRAEDELWDYVWYSYTDEWAWFRARQEVLKELGSKRTGVTQEALDRKTEEKYREHFEKYVSEVDMRDVEQKAQAKKEKKRAKK